MRVRCPNCHERVEVVSTSPLDEATCPNCGSLISTVEQTATETYLPDAARCVTHFTLLELIGQGGYGTVWKARDNELDRIVALKLAREDVRGDRRMLREARAAAQLHHPHIVPVHEVGNDNGHVYIVSDFIEGLTLRDKLEMGPLPGREAAEIALHMAEALQHAHEQKIIHRDVKPGNILLDGRGRPHLADFGLAKRDVADGTVTVEGKMLGTPAYMPPEQARGETQAIDARSDIYSLGATLYHMLTGSLPFRGVKRLMIYQVLNEEPPAPRKLKREIPRDLETIALKCLEKTPQRRYQTAGDLAEDLRRYLNGEPIKARPVSTAEHAWRWMRRHPARVAIGLLAIAVAVLSVLPFLPKPEFTRRVHLETSPAGANVIFVPMDPETGQPRVEDAVRPSGKTPVDVYLPPGRYFVEVEVPGRGFHQVFREVPMNDTDPPGYYRHQRWEIVDGTVRLPQIEIKQRDKVIASMIPLEGGTYTSGYIYAETAYIADIAAPHERQVQPYYLDESEVTIGDGRRELDSLPPELMNSPTKDDNKPLVHVSFDLALHFAEKMGKRLPDEFEMEFAATNGGQTVFPWGDEPRFDEKDGALWWPPGPVKTPDFDQTSKFSKPIYGLFSGAAEWTESVPLPFPQGLKAAIKPMPDAVQVRDRRTVRGAPCESLRGVPGKSSVLLTPRFRHGEKMTDQFPGLGFRCALSVEPRFLRLETKPTEPLRKN